MTAIASAGIEEVISITAIEIVITATANKLVFALDHLGVCVATGAPAFRLPRNHQ